MTKVQKALAKFYFALGDTGAVTSADVEVSAFMVEHRALIVLRGTGELFGLKFAKLGIASANRRAAPPRVGKSSSVAKPGKLLPPRGKSASPVKQAKRKKRGYDDFEDYDYEE
jgi:hypothetical protein